MKSNRLKSVQNIGKYVLLTFAFLLSANALKAQVISEVDTTKIRIGEQINYKINVETDTTNLVVFPEGQTFMPLEAVEALKIDTTKKESKFVLSRIYKLTQFDSGAYTIPRQKIIIGEKPFYTDSLRVEVNTITVDTTKQKLYDIKPIIEVEKSFDNWWKWLLLIILIIAIASFLMYWFIWRKKPLTEEEEIALLPPYERAKIGLKKLDESQYLIRSEVKEYYSELTQIIRNYLDEKVYERSLESTTDELITHLNLLKEGNQLPLTKDTIKNLESILKRADLVKFAKSLPDNTLIEMDRSTIEKELDNVKASLPEPNEEEKLLDQQYKEEQERKQKRKKVIISTAVAILVVALTYVGFGLKLGFKNLNDTLLRHESKLLLEGDWVKSAYGFPPIWIETPKVLKRENKESTIEKNEEPKIARFQYGSLSERFYVVTSTSQFNLPEAEDKETQIQQIVTNAVENNLKTWEESGVQNIITKNEKFTTPNGAEGLKTHGTGDFPDTTSDSVQKSNYCIFSFTNGKILQQVILMWSVDDEYADIIIKRIVDSIEVNPEDQKEETQE